MEDEQMSERVQARAEGLLPEEAEAGTDDAEAQAEIILSESDERSAGRNPAPGTGVEHRTSEEATEPH